MSTATRRPRSRSSRRAQRSNTPLLLGIVGLVVVLGVVLFFLRGGVQTVAGEERIPDQGGGLHLQNASDPLPVPYNSNPPTSGYHWGGGWAPWGVHEEPLADTVTVHNLEHGGVVIHYRQDLDQATVAQLQELTRSLGQQNQCVMLVPRPADQLDTPIVATAWNYLLRLESFDAEKLTQFFQNRVGYGFEKVCKPL